MKTAVILLSVVLLLSGCRSMDITKEETELSRTYYHLANAQMRLGSYPEAVSSYRRALEIDPSLHSAAYNLATAYEQIGDYSSALGVLDTVLEYDQGNTLLLRRKAWCLLQLDREDEALQVFRDALEVDPADREILRSLVQLLIEHEAYIEAREHIFNDIARWGVEQDLLVMLYRIDEQVDPRGGHVWLKESWNISAADHDTAELLSKYYFSTEEYEGAASVILEHARSGATGHAVKLAKSRFGEAELKELPEEQEAELRKLLTE